MPLYEYRCKQCGHKFEKIQTFSAPDEKECPVCKGELERLISAPAIQFKGAGWYVTDYAKGGSKKATASGESSGNASGESSGNASGGDGKSSSESKPASSGDGSSAPAKSSTPKSE